MLLHGIGHRQKGVGAGFGNLLLRLGRFEFVGVKEGPAQLFYAVAAGNVGEGDFVDVARIVVEVGVDDDGVDVAGDEQGRVVEVFAVKL